MSKLSVTVTTVKEVSNLSVENITLILESLESFLDWKDAGVYFMMDIINFPSEGRVDNQELVVFKFEK